MVNPFVLAGGFLLLLLGVVLLVPLPEAGVPTVLVSLRILGRRFAWARRANERFDAAVTRFRRRYRQAPRPVRALVSFALVGILVLLVVWVVAAQS